MAGHRGQLSRYSSVSALSTAETHLHDESSDYESIISSQASTLCVPLRSKKFLLGLKILDRFHSRSLEENSKSIERVSVHKADIFVENVEELHGDDPPISKSSTKSRRHQSWSSVWLSKLSLFGMLTILVLMAVILIALRWMDVAENGIRTMTTSPRYSWKYGPSAFIITIIVWWSQLDKYCRLLAPWMGRSGSSTLTSKELSIEYLTPMAHRVLYRAVRNSHISVIATVTGSLILKAILAISTALLLVTPTELSDPDAVLTARTSLISDIVMDGSQWAHLKTGVLLFYAHMNKGLPLQNGTTTDSAFQLPQLPYTNRRYSSFEANVDAFVSRYYCTVQNVTYSSLDSDGNFDVHFPSSICPTTTGSNPQNDTWKLRTVKPYSRNVYTGPDYLRYSYSTQPCINATSLDEVSVTDLFAVSRADVRADNCTNGTSWGEPGKILCALNATLSEVVAVKCQMDFDIGLARLVLHKNLQSPLFNIKMLFPSETNGSSPNRAGLSKVALQSAIPFIMRDFQDLPTSIDPVTPLDTYKGVKRGNFALLDRQEDSDGNDWKNAFDILAKSATTSDWLKQPNHDQKGLTLKQIVESTIIGVLAQWARVTLFETRPANTKVICVKYTEDRMRLSPLSYWLMLSGIFVLIGLTTTLMLFCPQTDIARSPASIFDFVMLLRNDRLYNDVAAAHSLESRSACGSKILWYRPLACRKPFAVALLLIPIVTAACLQGLQHLSDRSFGILAVQLSIKPFWLEAWTHYVPAALVILLAVAYSCLEFNILLFSPFSRLKGISRSSSIAHDLNIYWNLQALVVSYKIKQYGAIFAVLGAIIASTLSLTCSGLFSADALPFQFETSWQPSSEFNFLSNNGSGALGVDIDAALTLSLIDSVNPSYPIWTYDDLVLPSISLTDLLLNEAATDEDKFFLSFLIPRFASVRDNMTGVSIDLDMPAYRPSLRCTPIAKQNITASLISWSGYSFNITVKAQPQIDDRCTNAGRSPNSLGNPQFIWKNIRFHLLPEQDVMMVGAYLSELVYPVDNLAVSYEPFSVIDYSKFTDCPSLALLYGTMNSSELIQRPKQSNSSDGEVGVLPNITVLQCIQTVEHQTVNLKLHTPDFRVNKVNLVNTTSSTTVAIHFQEAFQNYYRYLNAPANASLMFDNFMLGAIYGSAGAAPLHFSGLLDNGTSEIGETVSKMYGRYAAQFFNSHTRQKTLIRDSLNRANVTSQNAWRIIQHRGPKTALQVLLIGMSLCGAAAYFLVDMRRTLLREPCSIAGKASLVLDSRLLVEMRRTSDKEHYFDDPALLQQQDAQYLKNAELKLSWWEYLENRKFTGDVFEHVVVDQSEAWWGIDTVVSVSDET